MKLTMELIVVLCVIFAIAVILATGAAQIGQSLLFR
jgi:hypothetical protein